MCTHDIGLTIYFCVHTEQDDDHYDDDNDHDTDYDDNDELAKTRNLMF